MTLPYRRLGGAALLAAALQLGMAQTADRTVVQPADPAAIQPAPAASGLVAETIEWLSPEEPTPLTAGRRWHDYWIATIVPGTILNEGVAAGFGQWENSPPEWGQGGRGYGKRFANDMAYNAVRNTLTYGTSVLFHEDNRYFASGKRTVAGRIAHALASPVTARRTGGQRSISISGVTGIVGVSLISRAWSPASWQGAGNVAISAGLTFAGTAGFNLVREFVPDIVRHFRK